MATSFDIEFYLDSAIRCFNEARRLEPSLAAIGMEAMGQAYLERAKHIHEQQGHDMLAYSPRTRVRAAAHVIMLANELHRQSVGRKSNKWLLIS